MNILQEMTLERDQWRSRAQKAERENICDVCAGTGNPLGNEPCICGGTGKMSDAPPYLRAKRYKAERERDKAIHVLCSILDRGHNPAEYRNVLKKARRSYMQKARAAKRQTSPLLETKPIEHAVIVEIGEDETTAGVQSILYKAAEQAAKDHPHGRTFRIEEVK